MTLMPYTPLRRLHIDGRAADATLRRLLAAAMQSWLRH